jgi:hypothetical protein
LTQKVKDIESFVKALPKKELLSDEKLFFRGHASKSYELKPSIYREGKWISNEYLMIQELLLRCPEDFKSAVSSFDKLVKMQHYDFPTRLLDITENPLVALYFACEAIKDDQSKLDKDGEVFLFNIQNDDIKYSDSDTVSVLSNLSCMDSNFCDQDTDETYFKSDVYSEQFLHFIKREKPYFIDRILKKDINSVVCVKPKLDNRRIIQQSGSFLLFGINTSKRDPATIDKKLMKESIIIDKDFKEQILVELSLLGINSAKLFPEIDKVANFIKYQKLQNKDFKDPHDAPVELLNLMF